MRNILQVTVGSGILQFPDSTQSGSTDHTPQSGNILSLKESCNIKWFWKDKNTIATYRITPPPFIWISFSTPMARNMSWAMAYESVWASPGLWASSWGSFWIPLRMFWQQALHQSGGQAVNSSLLGSSAWILVCAHLYSYPSRNTQLHVNGSIPWTEIMELWWP